MAITATIVTTSTGGVAVAFDYSSYFERIATSLEKIVELSTSTGIRTMGAYDWVRPTDTYSWYSQDQTTLVESTASVETLASNITNITNNFPKFL